MQKRGKQMTREEREKAIELLDNLKGMVEDNQGNDYDFAFRMGIEALKQFGNSEELGCIDRAEAMTEIQMNTRRYTIAKEFGGMGQVEWSDNLISIKDALDILRKLPSVKQEPKQGRWIRYKENCCYNKCSICEYEHCKESNYCPNCGAKMKSEG